MFLNILIIRLTWIWRRLLVNRKKARDNVNQVNSEDDLSGDTNEDNDIVFDENAEEDDVILNEVGESEDEDESDDQDDENNLTFVPQMTKVMSLGMVEELGHGTVSWTEHDNQTLN